MGNGSVRRSYIQRRRSVRRRCGDGDLDRDEFVNGTAATNPASCFSMPFVVTGNTFSVSFYGVTILSYVLHPASTLTDGVWSYGDSIENLQSNGTVNLQANTCDDPDTYFGRVKVSVTE